MNSIANLNYLDELVKEYLVFRGFTQTNHYFSLEKKSDKLKGFQVDRILEQINYYIANYDIHHLIELWNFLDITFFSRIDFNRNYTSAPSPSLNGGNHNHNNNHNSRQSNHHLNNSSFRHDLSSTIKKLSTSLKKYYVIYAVNNNRIDKVKEFFDLYSHELIRDPEWQHWFALPYIRNAHMDPFFEVYFSKVWSEAFSLSLRNFLSTIFKNIPLPKMLQFNLERQNRKRLESQVENLLQQNEELRSQLDKLEYQNKRDQSAAVSSGGSNLRRDNSSSNINTSADDRENSFSRVSKRSETSSLRGSVVNNHHHPSNSNNNLMASIDDDSSSGGVVIGSGRARRSITNNSTTIAGNSNSNSNSNVINSNNSSSSSSNTSTTNNSNNPTTATATATTTTNNTLFPNGLNSSGMEMGEMDENGLLKKSSFDVSSGEAMYTIESQETCTSHSSPITRCKFLSNGSKIASSSVDGTVRLWNVDGFSSRHTTIYCLSEVISLEWENKSKLLMCGTTDSKIKLWNSSTDKAIGDINTPPEFPRVEDLVCNPNGNSFVSSSNNLARTDGIVYTWNLRTLKVEDKFSSSNAVINSMSFNNSGTLLATGCVDGTIRIFDIKTGSPIAGWQAHTEELLSVQFASDENNKLYSMGKDGKLYQWNVHMMGKPLREYQYPGFPTDSHRTTKISFNSDSSTFIVGSNNKFALIYNVEQSSPVLKVSGHSGPVVSVDWHPTQNTCVTGSLDQTVRLSKLVKKYSLF
ncbi:hypothetical protein CYY_003658 [Polysphondylium violaceum]|uniref:WD40 repeat-containing protein n=1 Tax=Polysphondylium violaceum TaxID=133409 RepID=A0A8J4PUF0_9MYCE|nr:hypothetical protein CYY_003658 [Polysphondylium violaceum]